MDDNFEWFSNTVPECDRYYFIIRTHPGVQFGPPRGTHMFTAENLAQRGMVGAYIPKENSDAHAAE